MKTNINNIMDTVDEIKDLLVDIDKRLDNVENSLDELELSTPCECLVDVDIAKINDLIWHVQKLLEKTK